MRISSDERLKLDTVTDSMVLMDADALAQAAGGQVEEVHGRRAARVESGRIEFKPPKHDLRKFDQLVAVLYTEGRGVSPRLQVKLTTRTRGLPHDDSFNSGLSENTAYSEWGEYLFPYENFLVYGMGELLNPVDSISLRLGGDSPVWIAEIRVEKRDRAAGPRLTDAGLRAELEIPFDNESECVAHFRNRSAPVDIYSDLPKPGPGWTPETADAICDHIINGYDAGDPIDWRINPNGYLEWMHAFNRHVWFNELMKAFSATSEAKYVRALDEMWLSWLRDNPEPVGHNGGGDAAWETLSTACRIYGSWLYGWFGLLHNADFRDSTRIEILKSFYGHAEHLTRYQGYANNWLIVESRAIFALGILFPEFRRAKAWLEEGKQRLTRELERQIFPDGADWEFAPGYHMMASRGFLEPYELAQKNGMKLPAIFEERLPKTFEYVAGVTRPDGTMPSFNDSSGYKSRSGRSFLEYGARLFDRPDLSGNAEGPFAGRSRAFPDSGFHVLASGKGHDALWSLFDCGAPGASHQHYDALNLEIFAYGLPFIVDPGITGYLKDDWCDYYRATRSHNTLLVNGCGQRTNRATESVRGQALCAFGDKADFVCGRYEDGYEGLPEGIVHQRAFLFIREKMWLIFDEVRGSGVEEIEARFQFEPMRLTIDRRQRRFRSLRQNKPNVEIITALPTKGARLSVATGETDPVGGWVSHNVEDIPAPQARVRLTAPGEPGESIRMVTLIAPYKSGLNSGISVRPIAAFPGSACGIRIMKNRREEARVIYSWRGEALPYENVQIKTPLILTMDGDTQAVKDCGWIEL